MINKLEIWNFKSVEHTEMIFEEGLTALRGANEHGKSTRFDAIKYAFFGARALPLSLAETVTWGKPESSLKVAIEFTHSGHTYALERSKAGASMSCNSLTLLVSGQSECTKYIEGLFGVNADTASKIIVASQNGLRGALADRSAVPLIEKMAGLSVIDEVITKVQNQLPSGNTKLIEAQIADLEKVEKPVKSTVELEADLHGVEHTLEVEKKLLAQLETESKQSEVAYIEALAFRQKAKQREEQIAACKLTKTSLTQRLAKPPVVFDANLDELMEKSQKQATLKATVAAYDKYQRHLPAAKFYTGDLTTHLKSLEDAHTELVAKIANLNSDLRVALMGAINEKECSLCGKLLQEVPEVVTKNAAVKEKSGAIQLALEGAKVAKVTLLEKLAELKAIHAEDVELRSLHASLSDYLKPITTTPPTLEWDGPVPIQDSTDYAAQLAVAAKQQSAAAVDKSLRQTAEKDLAEVQAWLKDNGTPLDTSSTSAAIKAHLDATAKVDLQRTVVADATKRHYAASSALSVALAQHEKDLEAYNKVQESLSKAKATLAEYASNNELIKRLREARPLVAARLWTVVLASVSTYFSQVRGVASTVTVSEGNFMVDGKPAEAFSGSTLDSLGLAIRMALSKTFLPNLDFLLLDEPAAGMDDEREAAMLGLLAAANFEQVVVVTHSNIADSVANQVIQI